jgi:beta-lactam-binding protein with PASTA domain
MQFLKNVFTAFVLTALLVLTSYFALGWYTNHGEDVKVPDLKGLTYDQVKVNLSRYALDFYISDSAFIEGKPRGIILEQYPAAESIVKPGRKIYLKINMYAIPKIKMPDVVDASFRTAKELLESYGLKLGKVSYKPDEAENAILSMSINGKPIKAGDMVYRTSTVDLVVADGLGNTMIPVPNLIGLTLSEATFLLNGSSLQLGSSVYDEAVTDKANAIIYKQTPEAPEVVALSDMTLEEKKENEKKKALTDKLNENRKEEEVKYEVVNEKKTGMIKLGEFVDVFLSNNVLPASNNVDIPDVSDEFNFNNLDSNAEETTKKEAE